MFDFRELITSSFEALARNKTRTMLATLGIVIGIGAVIALISLGQSSQKAVTTQIESLGANLLTVLPGSTRSFSGVRGAAGGASTLTHEDAQAMTTATDITTVNFVSPELSRRSQVIGGGNNSNTQIVGATQAYLDVHAVTMSSGSFISARDLESASRVAVLGPQVVTDLFGENGSAIGQTVRIGKTSFRVIGVTKAKGGSGFQNQDDMIFVPLTTAQRQLFGTTSVSSIAVQVKDKTPVTSAEDQVGYFLLARHHISDPAQADFSLLSQQDILGAASQVTGTLTALLSGIAAISLLVGGIGIMNIMLVTVIERTREIGLRKALGARRKTIITQFLAEAILLTFGGGVLGILLGLSLSFLASGFLHLPTTLSPSAVALAVGVSAGIGILFGLYPAQKAARLTPIEALRYE